MAQHAWHAAPASRLHLTSPGWQHVQGLRLCAPLRSGIVTCLISLQSVGKVSGAARGLCLWVRAMETYGTVARDVAPKRAKLKAAQDNLAKKQTALAAAQQQLAEVLAKVQKLKVGVNASEVLLGLACESRSLMRRCCPAAQK